jgi:hypothetical protein
MSKRDKRLPMSWKKWQEMYFASSEQLKEMAEQRKNLPRTVETEEQILDGPLRPLHGYSLLSRGTSPTQFWMTMI